MLLKCLFQHFQTLFHLWRLSFNFILCVFASSLFHLTSLARDSTTSLTFSQMNNSTTSQSASQAKVLSTILTSCRIHLQILWEKIYSTSLFSSVPPPLLASDSPSWTTVTPLLQELTSSSLCDLTCPSLLSRQPLANVTSLFFLQRARKSLSQGFPIDALSTWNAGRLKLVF